MADSIFSVIEGLTVSKDDIIEAETFAEQYLSAQFPTYDFRQGTALRDMTIRPNATLLALVNKAVRFYFDQSDISNITDDTDNSLVDNRLSNFFITRQTGTKAIVRARLYFSFPTSTPIATAIPTSAFFSTDNVLRYNTRGLISVNPPVEIPDPNSFYFRLDSAQGLWYVDVDLESETESLDANIGEGDLLYFTVFSPYFIRGDIQYLVGNAIATETNTEMVNRSYSAISTRNLINAPSIISRITDQFNYANSVLPIGLGDDLLYRDIISIADVNNPGTVFEHHRGGIVDVYVDTAPILQSVQLVSDAQGNMEVSGPVYHIRRSTTAPSNLDPDTLPLDVDFSYAPTNVSEYVNSVPTTPGDDVGLSARQITRITVPGAIEGETATFDVSAFSGIAGINTAINSKEQRVVCADYLARSFEPFFIDMVIATRNTDSTRYEAAVDAIESYIEGIPNGGTMYISSIIAAIQATGITDVVLPVTATSVNKHKYIQYDSADESVVDETITMVTDSISLRDNQVFYPRNISMEAL